MYTKRHTGARLFCSRIGYPTTTILFFRMFTSLLGFTAVIEISPAHLPVACTRRLHTQNNKLVQFGCTVDCLAWTRETSTRESFSMERGPELSAVLWTVLILCIVLIFYLSFVPEDRQQKDKDAADAFTATVIPSFKKKPDDKKTT